MKKYNICEKIRSEYDRVIFTNGCFDLLHPGHIATFLYCNKLANEFSSIVVVGINDDESVRRLKGDSRPILDLEARVNILEHISLIDYVIPFSEDTPEELLKYLNPDIVVKGFDYSTSDVVSCGALVLIAKDDKIDGKYSTTKIINKIREGR